MSAAPIVAGTDGSPTAERAVEKAGELAGALGAEVHVVASYGPSTTASWMGAAGGMTMVAVADDESRAHAETAVTRSEDRLRAQGITVHTHVSSCDPAEALLTVAADQRAQMIVVGNRGMTGARRLLGSVPNRVSHHARCAVLIVPTGDDRADDPVSATEIAAPSGD